LAVNSDEKTKTKDEIINARNKDSSAKKIKSFFVKKI